MRQRFDERIRAVKRSSVSRLRRFGSGDFRHPLLLKAQRDEQMSQAIDGLMLEEVAAEIDGETRAKTMELVNQHIAVQARHDVDQLFDLFGM